MSNIDLQAIEQFLYLETSYLDNPDLDTWFSLFTEDGTYWMPASENQPDPLNHISHFYDDRVMMEVRRRNFVHPRAASKDHKVRCSHIIGNVQHTGQNDKGDLIITSNFQAMMFYRNEQRMYGGRYTHHLLTAGDSFKIRHKKVELINCEAPQKSIIIYI